jgi:hypothetical protein
VAILKKEAPACAPNVDPPDKDRVVDFSYTSDSLAQMIVDAWVKDGFEAELTTKSKAKSLLAARGFFLENPVVITEKQYNDHFRREDDREIVFVIPDRNRVTQRIPPGQSLLDTARLLMAITPNGI